MGSTGERGGIKSQRTGVFDLKDLYKGTVKFLGKSMVKDRNTKDNRGYG